VDSELQGNKDSKGGKIMNILKRLNGEIIEESEDSMREICERNKHNLRNADLGDVDLRNADLWGADLRGVDLRDANLWDADLRDADLRDADLKNTDFRNAELRTVKISKKQLPDLAKALGIRVVE